MAKCYTGVMNVHNTQSSLSKYPMFTSMDIKGVEPRMWHLALQITLKVVAPLNMISSL